MIALDTNLLAYAQRLDSPQNRHARKAIDRALDAGAGVTTQSIVELWAVLTDARYWSNPSTPADVATFLGQLWAADAQMLCPQPDFAREMASLGKSLGVVGRRTQDLAIAITARSNGATELWTHDARFVAIKGLTVKFPLHTA